jgi:hypothetical protein
MAARDLRERAAARQQRDADPHLDRALDAVEAGQRDLDVDRRLPALVGAQHAVARRRRIVVRDHDLASDFLQRHAVAPRQRMFRRRQQHHVVAAERERLHAAIRRLEREHAEVEAAIEDGVGDLPGRHAPDVDDDVGMSHRESLDVRQQAVHGRFVGADDDAAAAHLLQLADGRLRLAGEPEEPLRIVLQEASGLGQRAVARRAVEQPLAQLILDPPDRLADGGLRPVQAPRRGRKAAIRGHREESRQVRQLHKPD